jgi:hypothetical protein
MKVKKRWGKTSSFLSVLLLVLLILSAFTGCYSAPLPVFTSSNSSNEYPPVIYTADGVKYVPCDISQWYFLDAVAIGTTEWSKVMIFGAKSDANRSIIFFKKSFDESLLYYAREGFQVPQLNRDNINGVEWVIDPGQAGQNIVRDKSVIETLFNTMENNQNRTEADIPAEKAAQIYLYSDKLPGCAYRCSIWKWNGKYFMINLSLNSIFLEDDLIKKLNPEKKS